MNFIILKYYGIQWDNLFASSVVNDLPKYEYNHCLLVLQTSMTNLNTQSFFRFDKSWTDNPEFIELFVKWWSEFKLCEDISNCWHEKMKYKKREMKGQNKNFLAGKKEKKTDALHILHTLEKK
jgi:hypothetical protein